MTVDEFYKYIVKHMTPEEALRKLLVGGIMKYEQLKFPEDGTNPVHPEFIIAMAALDLGWDIAIEKEKEGETDSEVRGICVGTRDYMKDLFSKKTEPSKN